MQFFVLKKITYSIILLAFWTLSRDLISTLYKHTCNNHVFYLVTQKPWINLGLFFHYLLQHFIGWSENYKLVFWVDFLQELNQANERLHQELDDKVLKAFFLFE